MQRAHQFRPSIQTFNDLSSAISRKYLVASFDVLLSISLQSHQQVHELSLFGTFCTLHTYINPFARHSLNNYPHPITSADRLVRSMLRNMILTSILYTTHSYSLTHSLHAQSPCVRYSLSIYPHTSTSTCRLIHSILSNLLLTSTLYNTHSDSLTHSFGDQSTCLRDSLNIYFHTSTSTAIFTRSIFDISILTIHFLPCTFILTHNNHSTTKE